MNDKRLKVKAIQRFEADYAEPKSIVNKFIEHPKVSIVILVKDALYYVKKCIKTLKAYTNNYELIVVDNDSNQETKNYLKKIDGIDFTLIRNKINMGFSYGNNQAIKIAKYDYICFLNSDTLLTPNWLGKLTRGFKYQDNVGIVGPSTCNSPTLRSVQILNNLIEEEVNQKIINKFAAGLDEYYKEATVVGFCFVIKKELFEKIGVFDWKRYGLASYEDIDLIWRALKYGYKSIWSTASYVHHFGNKSFEEARINPMEIRKKHKLIFEKRIEDSNLYIENNVKLGEIIKIKNKKGEYNANT